MGPEPEHWRRIDALLDEALELAPEALPAFLEGIGEVELRREVEALLAAESEAGDFLENPARDYAAPLLDEALEEAEALPEPAPGGGESGFEGRRLGSYRILRRVGRGGMGEVFSAEDERLRRQVAVKILPPSLGGSPGRLRRFEREARALAALSHPGIVTIHSVEEDDGVHFLTMELVRGRTLAEAMPEGGFRQDELLRIAIALADALASAHGQGVIHRDLKPANVMLTDEGRVKVLDFGIAKLSGPEGDEAAGSTRLTEQGGVLGTVAYMSPEQLAGRLVDPRSDLFSLGVLLHQMATGEHPFGEGSTAELISAILRDPPRLLESEAGEISPALAGLIGHCLEKSVERRPASAALLRDDLEAERRRLGEERLLSRHSRATAARESAGARSPNPLAAGGSWSVAGALVLALVAFFWWRGGAVSTEEPSGSRRQATSLAVQAPAGPPVGLAVLDFQNLTGDPELDWLRGGLADLLVTDLAQSPRVRALSTSRVYQILGDLGGKRGEEPTFELLQGLAEQGQVEALVRGSFARVGEIYRVLFTLEDGASGTILRSERVEGSGEESLFALIDQLSTAIRANFEVEGAAGSSGAESAGTVEKVTTSSLEAWRLYSEGSTLYNLGQRQEAIGRFEAALRIDPEFALAMADLGQVHENLGHAADARLYTAKAVEHAARLPENRRYLLEAVHLSSTWSTYDGGINAWEKAVAAYPQHVAWRNNLALQYAFVERYRDSIRELEELIGTGTSFAGTYNNAALVYAALDRFETGERILRDFSIANPERWQVHYQLGWHLSDWGRLDEAGIALDRAAELRPGEIFVHHARWRLEALRGEWPRAEAEAESLLAKDDPFARWRGHVSRARGLLFQGRSRAATGELERAIAAPGDPSALTALARVWLAELLLQLGRPEPAFQQAELARQEGEGEWPELLGIYQEAMARQALRKGDPAPLALLEELGRQGQSQRSTPEARLALGLEGRLALGRGEVDAALATLSRAERLLPARGIEIHWHVFPDHLPIWFALGEAELAADNPERAKGWFLKVAESGSERLEQSIPWVRSLAKLGHLSLSLGQPAEARAYLERYLSHWGRGDLDRDEVRRVQEMLEELGES